MRFKNREEAAGLLAQKLIKYKGDGPLVLGIPRGAVPMAKIIADAVEGDLDVVLVHKLRAPGNPESLIGAMDEYGHIYWRGITHMPDLSDAYLAEKKERQVNLLRERRVRYSGVHPPADPSGRIVIIVDEGIATGASMIAALHSVRAKWPKKVVVAAAVASYQSFKRIQQWADEVVCLHVPEDFYAIGEFFEAFPPVSDEEVIATLRQSRSESNEANHINEMSI